MLGGVLGSYQTAGLVREKGSNGLPAYLPPSHLCPPFHSSFFHFAQRTVDVVPRQRQRRHPSIDALDFEFVAHNIVMKPDTFSLPLLGACPVSPSTP